MKTHWKKLQNPDYLGAYALDPGKDLVATIRSVGNEMVIGADGKKEECMVMHFSEKIKPMIINSTNAKTIQKLYKTPYIEEWAGRRIQLFVDNVKAFGETVEALRIRPFLPKIVGQTKCSECESEITATDKMTAVQIADYAQRKFGRALCAECMRKLSEKKPDEQEAVIESIEPETLVETEGGTDDETNPH